MIHATLTQDAEGRYVAYEAKGHAGYDADGRDIVCAAVSILGVTCVNSLEKLAGIVIHPAANEEGHLSFCLPDQLSKESVAKAQVLLGSLEVGLQAVAEQYPKYLSLTTRKCHSGDPSPDQASNHTETRRKKK